MSKATAQVAEKKPAAARGGGKTTTTTPWWNGAREPNEKSQLVMAVTRPEYGGEYLILWLGDADGRELIKRGISAVSLESIKKRTFTLLPRGREEGPTRGFHKIRLTAAMRPHIHLPIEDGKFKTVETKSSENEIELRFVDEKVVFDLPASIR